MTDRVLVTDGGERAALAVVRSLGRAGHVVHVVSPRRRSLAGASRYARTDTQGPDPLAEPTRFIESVARLARRLEIEVVLPVTDAAMLALAERRDSLLPAALPVPALDRIIAVGDKGRVAREAALHGLAVPRQIVARSREELVDATERATYPMVVKPSRSVVGSGASRAKLGVRVVRDATETLRLARALPPAAFPVLLQERITGPGVGVFLLLWRGELRAAFMHRRLREKPPSGGVSVYREGIPLDHDLVARSRSLLQALGWEGVAMVEYKIDRSSGTPYLMEINGRFWGSLQLAVDSGVDFPRMALDLARDRDPGPVPDYASGLRSRWTWGDVDHLLARIRHARDDLALPPDAPGLGRLLFEVLIPWRPGDRNEIFRWSDPAPFVRETTDWFRGR